MSYDPFESAKRDRAIEIYSDFLEEVGHPSEETFQRLILQHSSIAAELIQLRKQWIAADAEEFLPFGGFRNWFPKQLGEYQILKPLSQTPHETVCLARNRVSNRFFALRMLTPDCGPNASDLRRNARSSLEINQSEGIDYAVFEFGEETVLAMQHAGSDLFVIEEKPKENKVAAPKTGSLIHRWRKVRHAIGSIWRRPMVPTLAIGMVGMIASFKFFELPSQTAMASSIGPAAMSTATHVREAIQATENRSIQQAWKSYAELHQLSPDSYLTEKLYRWMEQKLVSVPRSVPSPRPSIDAKVPLTFLDFAVKEFIEADTQGMKRDFDSFLRGIEVREASAKRVDSK